VSTAAAMSIAAACKGDASLASGRHHYRVNTRGDRRRDGCADDRIVYSLPHDVWAAMRHGSKDVVLIMPSGWTASGGVDVCGNRGAKQSGPIDCFTHDGGRGCCAGGTSVKSRKTDRENGYENRLPVFSYERSPS